MEVPIRPHFLFRGSAGITLVELLTVLCVIGLLVAIALPQISALASGNAQEARHRRNAQELAAVCASADAAGLSFARGNDLDQTVRKIIEGATPSDGPFKGKMFAVKGLVDEDVKGVKKYLSLSNGQLTYNSTGQGTAARLEP